MPNYTDMILEKGRKMGVFDSRNNPLDGRYGKVAYQIVESFKKQVKKEIGKGSVKTEPLGRSKHSVFTVETDDITIRLDYRSASEAPLKYKPKGQQSRIYVYDIELSVEGEDTVTELLEGIIETELQKKADS